MKILVTGGAGFIGSNFIRHILLKYPKYKVINLDKLTYAGNLDNLKDVAKNKNYKFVKGDICNTRIVEKFVPTVDAIVNFAAETHVDRSIMESGSFIKTDIFGTHALLEAAKKYGTSKYIQISTDEVYGSILKASFREDLPLRPNSPYSASKAGGDLLARSYYITHKVPVIITRASNNFGPYQYPEKVIPLFVTNALEDKPLPLYGDGKNIRDWLYVNDHCKAIDLVLHKGKIGEIYNIGGGNEINNLELTRLILEFTGKSRSLIKKVQDRPGHDRRYSLDYTKIQRELGYKPSANFIGLLKETVQWYKNNEWWWQKLRTKEYFAYYKKQYKA